MPNKYNNNVLSFEAVNKSGDTMTGNLNIMGADIPLIDLKSSTRDSISSVAPSSTAYFGAYRCKDKNGRLTGQLISYNDINNNIGCSIEAKRRMDDVDKTASLGVGINTNGNPYCIATKEVKQSLASWAFPSTTKVTNPIPTTITKGGNHTYTAPCDGLFTFMYSTMSGANAVAVQLNGTSILYVGSSANGAHRMSGAVPVSKGMVIKVNTDTQDATGTSYFWYAKSNVV